MDVSAFAELKKQVQAIVSRQLILCYFNMAIKVTGLDNILFTTASTAD